MGIAEELEFNLAGRTICFNRSFPLSSCRKGVVTVVGLNGQLFCLPLEPRKTVFLSRNRIFFGTSIFHVLSIALVYYTQVKQGNRATVSTAGTPHQGVYVGKCKNSILLLFQIQCAAPTSDTNEEATR